MMSIDSHTEGYEGTQYLKFTCYFSTREKKIMREIFGEEYPSIDLPDREVMRILGRVRQSARIKLNTDHIVPHIKKHYYLLTDSEVTDILDPTLTPQQQTLRFVDYLVYKGTYGLGCLYFSLVETSEEMYGIPTHFQLACELKKAIIEGSSIHDYSLTAEAVYGEQETKEAIDEFISCLGGVVISVDEGRSLAESLGIKLQGIVTDLKEVCSLWRKKRSAICTKEDLVEALVLTRNLGRHTARLCSPGIQHSVVVKTFFHGLGLNWLNIAYYLGYTEDEVSAMMEGDVEQESCERQISLFLDVWHIPDCGLRTITILQKLKVASKVPDPGRPVSARKQAVSKPTVSLDTCERHQYSQSLLPSSSSSYSSYPSTSSLPLETTSNSSYPAERTLLVYQTGGDYGDDYETPTRLFVVRAKYYTTDGDYYDNYDSPGRYDNTGPRIEELPSDTVSNMAEYRGEQLKTLLASVNEAKSKSSTQTSESSTTSTASQQLSWKLLKSDALPDSIPQSNGLTSTPQNLLKQESASSKLSEESSLSSGSVLLPIPAQDTSLDKTSTVVGSTLMTSSRHSSLTGFSVLQAEAHSSHGTESKPPSQLVPAPGGRQLTSGSEHVLAPVSSTASSSAVASSLTATETQPSSARTDSSISALTEGTSSEHSHLSEPVLVSSSDNRPLLVTPKTVTVYDGFHDQSSSAGAVALSVESMRNRAVEILHDFSQYLTAAALKRNKIEDIISAAEKRGHTELVHFFYQYFYDTVFHGRGAELVSAFLKGFPSPMMFLFLEKLVTRDDFESVLEDYGLKDQFGDDLAMAFHQIAENTDGLPWSGSELLTAMFAQQSVFATVSSSALDGSMTTTSHHIPPELLHQLLSQSQVTLRPPEGSGSFPGISSSHSGPSRPPTVSRPEESKPSIVVSATTPSDVPSDPIDVTAHQRLPSASSEHSSSVTNDFNNLDILDDVEPVAQAVNTFSDGLTLNTWDTEGAQGSGLVSATQETSRSETTPSSTTTSTSTPTTVATTSATTTTTSATMTTSSATMTATPAPMTTTPVTTNASASGNTPTAASSQVSLPLATSVVATTHVPASLTTSGASGVSTSSSQPSDSRIRRENEYNSRFLRMASTASDEPNSTDEAVATDTVSTSTVAVTTSSYPVAHDATTPSTSATMDVVAMPLFSTSEGVTVVTGALGSDLVVSGTCVTHDAARLKSEELLTRTSSDPLTPTTMVATTQDPTGLSVAATDVAPRGSDVVVTASSRTPASSTATFLDPVSPVSAASLPPVVLSTADFTRTSEWTVVSTHTSVLLTASTASMTFTTASVAATHNVTMDSLVSMEATNSGSPVAMATANSNSLVTMATADSNSFVTMATADSTFPLTTMSTVPTLVTSHNSPLLSISESVDEETDGTPVSCAVADGSVDFSDSEGDGSDAGEPEKLPSVSLKQNQPPSSRSPQVSPKLSSSSKSAAAASSQPSPPGPTSHSPSSTFRKGSQARAKKGSEKTVKTPGSGTRDSGGMGRTDKASTVKKATRPVGTSAKTSTPRTGSARVPIPAKQPVKDPVCKSHVPVRTSGSGSPRTRLKLTEHAKKEGSAKTNSTALKSTHSLPPTSTTFSSVSLLSSTSEELAMKKKDTAGNSKKSPRDRTSIGKSKVGLTSGGKNGTQRSTSQEALHSISSLRHSKTSAASRLSSSSLYKSRAGTKGSDSPGSQQRDIKRQTHKETKATGSSESLPNLENGMEVKTTGASSPDSAATSPYSERHYTHLPISDTPSESEDETSISSQLDQKMSMSASSLQSLTQEPVAVSVGETRPENPIPEPEVQVQGHEPVPETTVSETKAQVAQSQEDSKTMPDSFDSLSSSQQSTNTSIPAQLRSEHFEDGQSELLSQQIPESSTIFKTIASRLHNWKMLGRYLMLEDEEIDRISVEYNFTAEQAYQMFMTWVGKNPSAATYAMLIESLKNSLREDLIMEVVRTAKSSQRGLVVQVSGDGGTVAFNAEVSQVWRTMQPFVDRWSKEGFGQVEVNMRFRK